MAPNSKTSRKPTKLDLEARIEELQGSLRDVGDGITEFLIHLTSSKFHEDPTMQKMDIHTRLMALRSLVIQD